MSTTDDEKQFIRAQIEALDATRVLEIGAFKGHTTRVLRDAVTPRGGYVVVIDPMQWSSEFLRNGILRHMTGGLPGIGTWLERRAARLSYERDFWQNVGTSDPREVLLFRNLSTDASLVQRNDQRLERFDAAFIDGDHSYEGARFDLLHWGRRVRRGGCILVHDAVPRFAGVVRALREWEFDPRVQVCWPSSGTVCTIRVLDDLRPARALA